MIRNRTATAMIGAAVALGALAPGASARPAEEFLQSQPSGSGGAYQAAPVQAAEAGGFDWGDAAVGAAGALIVTMAGLSGVAAVLEGRRREGLQRAR